MWPVLQALSDWAQQWTDLTTEHADPDAVLWSWAQSSLRTEVLPERRVVVRFDFHNRALPSWNRAPEAHAAGHRDPIGAARSLSVEDLPGT